jgi:hypothetical protein
VTNVGNVTLSEIEVTDDQEEELFCPATTLSAGETMTYTACALAQLGQYANIGTVTATPLVGTAVEASDPSHHRGLLSFLYVYLPVVMRRPWAQGGKLASSSSAWVWVPGVDITTSVGARISSVCCPWRTRPESVGKPSAIHQAGQGIVWYDELT